MMLKAVTRLHTVIIDLIMSVNTCMINCRLQMDFKKNHYFPKCSQQAAVFAFYK